MSTLYFGDLLSFIFTVKSIASPPQLLRKSDFLSLHLGQILPTFMSRLFRFWVKQIESQYRIRIGSEIAEIVPWLKAEKGFQASCTAFIGPDAQLRIAQSYPGAEVEASLISSPLPFDQNSGHRVKLARFAATTWPLTFSFEESGNRFTLVLPKEPRELAIIPTAGAVVVFALGDLVELWNATEWVKYVQAASADIQNLISNATEEMEN